MLFSRSVTVLLARAPAPGAGHHTRPGEATQWRRHPGTAGVYDELYSVYRSLYPALLEQQHTLARFPAAQRTVGLSDREGGPG